MSDAFPGNADRDAPHDPAAPEDESELAVEGALRPGSLAEFVGQQKVRGQLQLLVDEDGRAVIAGQRLRYDTELGLMEET